MIAGLSEVKALPLSDAHDASKPRRGRVAVQSAATAYSQSIALVTSDVDR
jgi:hypothetical protein